MGLFDFFKKKAIDTPESLYNQAKLISKYLFKFPYIEPANIDQSLRRDKPLVEIIKFAYKTTIGRNGKTCQTTIDSDERIRYQGEFKKRIYELLDKCLALDSGYAPAFLLYPIVAAYNTRAADRPGLITIHERFLGKVDLIKNGTREYKLIEKDIEGHSGNFYDQVERYLADLYFDLGQLYLKERRFQNAITEFEKAVRLMPLLGNSYSGLSDAYVKNGEYDKAYSLWKKARKLPFDKLSKPIIKQRYEHIKSEIKRVERFFKLATEVMPVIGETPGIIQKDVYAKFNVEHKDDISSILRSLNKAGLVIRKKKGSSHQLFVEKPVSEILEAAKQIYWS